MAERPTRAHGGRLKPRKATNLARLSVIVDDHDGYAVVTVAGEVDVTTGSLLREPLHDLVRGGSLHHVADLRGVTFLDSTGLGILVGDHKRLRDRGGSLQLVCGSGPVTRVLRVTGVGRVLPVRPTVEAAVALLDQPDSA
jgi:anti-anti-sigma factor